MTTIPPPKIFTTYVIEPHFLEAKYAAVYENFERDIYDALEQSLERLVKYHTIKIIFLSYTYHPREIVQGFTGVAINPHLITKWSTI